MSELSDWFVAGKVLQFLRDNFPSEYTVPQIAHGVESSAEAVGWALELLQGDDVPEGALVEATGGDKAAWRARVGVRP